MKLYDCNFLNHPPFCQVPFQEFGDEADDELEGHPTDPTDPTNPNNEDPNVRPTDRTGHSGDLSVSFHEVSFVMEDEEVTSPTSLQSERLSLSDQIAALDEASSGSDSDLDSVR